MDMVLALISDKQGGFGNDGGSQKADQVKIVEGSILMICQSWHFDGHSKIEVW
jgi:hypothetical protein